MYLKNGLTFIEYNKYKNKYIPLIKSKINIVLALYTDSITCLKRDYYTNISLEKRNFLNQNNVYEYNTSLFNMKELSKNQNINLLFFDTTNKSEREISIEVVNKILDDMRLYYINNIIEKIKYILENTSDNNL